MPDGSVPFVLMNKWGRWVIDCINLLDGDGTYRHWKYNGAYADQPWIDLQIYSVIRQRFIELKNDDINTKFGKMSSGPKKKSRGTKRPHRRR